MGKTHKKYHNCICAFKCYEREKGGGGPIYTKIQDTMLFSDVMVPKSQKNFSMT